MDEKQKEFMVEVLKAVPPTIGALFGDFLSKALGITALAGQGWEWLIQKNKETLDRYWQEADTHFAIDDARKSAENIQFLREWVTKIAFETREEKRENFLNIAINYHKKEDYSFDKKLLYLNIIDKMSEDELVYFLKIYDPLVNSPDDGEEMNNLLISHGLLEIDERKIQDSFEKVSEDIKEIRKFLEQNTSEYSKSIKPRLSSFAEYNHHFDKPKFQVKLTQLGIEFYEFLQKDESKKSKVVLKNIEEFI